MGKRTKQHKPCFFFLGGGACQKNSVSWTPLPPTKLPGSALVEDGDMKQNVLMCMYVQMRDNSAGRNTTMLELTRIQNF